MNEISSSIQMKGNALVGDVTAVSALQEKKIHTDLDWKKFNVPIQLHKVVAFPLILWLLSPILL